MPTLTKDNPRFVRVQEVEDVLPLSEHGWFCTKDEPDIRVEGSTMIDDDARICDEARICDKARVYGKARVCDKARVYDDARIYDDAHISGAAVICNNAHVSGRVQVSGRVHVSGSAHIYDNAHISDNAYICDNAHVSGSAHISGSAQVCGKAHVYEGQLIGTAIYGVCFKWQYSMVSPTKVEIGCQIHTIDEWLAPVEKSVVPWKEYTTPDEQECIQSLIRTVMQQAKLSGTWA